MRLTEVPDIVKGNHTCGLLKQVSSCVSCIGPVISHKLHTVCESLCVCVCVCVILKTLKSNSE